jgi:hypothetical protein
MIQHGQIEQTRSFAREAYRCWGLPSPHQPEVMLYANIINHATEKPPCSTANDKLNKTDRPFNNHMRTSIFRPAAVCVRQSTVSAETTFVNTLPFLCDNWIPSPPLGQVRLNEEDDALCIILIGSARSHTNAFLTI